MNAGTRLGSYEIQGPLGAGGMGEVYRARDLKLGREVAIKILPAAFATDPDRLARFQREARLLATLSHPHIATIHGVEDAGGVYALVMELVDGPTLAELLADGPGHHAPGPAEAGRHAPGPAKAGRHGSGGGRPDVTAAFRRTSAGLPIAEALAIARQLADALDTAHEKGIVHRVGGTRSC